MNRIRQLRDERHWTQDYLGRLLNIKRPAISKYENESIPLTAATLKELSKIFNVSIDYILGITNDREKKKDTTTTINIPESKLNLVEEIFNTEDEIAKEIEQYLNYLKVKKATGTTK